VARHSGIEPSVTANPYDRLAWIYNRYIAEGFLAFAFSVITELFLGEVPVRGRILDLCCGTGQLARTLSQRGYRVTGLDSSRQMLRFARENAPQSEFLAADARSFELPGQFHGAVSTYNSLAHFDNMEELVAVFRNVHKALLPGGLFLFDVSMEEAYRSKWRGTLSWVQADHVCVLRPSYDGERALARNDFTVFMRRGKGWQRSDFCILQKCHRRAELRAALNSAGFAGIRAYDAERDLKIPGERGRSFFLCRKPAL